MQEIDESARTSPRVAPARTMVPVGMLIHTTSGKNSLAFLMGGSAVGPGANFASADYLIDRDGTRHKIIPPGHHANHAGVGRFFHKDRLYRNAEVSQLLIGVELEQWGEEDITREQYISLAELARNLQREKGWPGDFPILGHYATARQRGRRSDPCNFDWGVFFALLR